VNWPAIQGAFIVICIAGVAVALGVVIYQQVQAWRLGRALLAEFSGDHEMAWDEIEFIIEQRKLLQAMAAKAALTTERIAYLDGMRQDPARRLQ
jgi:hypothetical protein